MATPMDKLKQLQSEGKVTTSGSASKAPVGASVAPKGKKARGTKVVGDASGSPVASPTESQPQDKPRPQRGSRNPRQVASPTQNNAATAAVLSQLSIGGGAPQPQAQPQTQVQPQQQPYPGQQTRAPLPAPKKAFARAPQPDGQQPPLPVQPAGYNFPVPPPAAPTGAFGSHLQIGAQGAPGPQGRPPLQVPVVPQLTAAQQAQLAQFNQQAQQPLQAPPQQQQQQQRGGFRGRGRGDNGRGRGGLDGRGRGRGRGGDAGGDAGGEAGGEGRGRGGYNAREERPMRRHNRDGAEIDEDEAVKPKLDELPANIDEDLVKQFLGRYDLQEEQSDKGREAPPGLLDVDEALKVIDENDVTFIVTDTGTGKSTMLPKALLELGHKVVSSQPRRTATINLAARVASLRNEQLGKNVGYLVRGDRIGDEDTRLMYMTSYTLFLYIISHPEDLQYTHFIIDEFHERQPDVEVMLALLKLARQKQKQTFKIILMSASVEVNEWKSYFDGLNVGIYSTCQPRYPVYEYFQEEVCRFIGAAYNPQPVTPKVGSLTLHNTLFMVKKMLTLLAKYADPQHSILVFLPGRTLVEDMAQYITKNLGDQLDPVQWYRDVDLDRIDAAFKREVTTRKKVYLATDIAEVSITLPDVVFIIDSGTTKKPRIDTGVRNTVLFPPLELLWTSKSSVSQRKGRVGRVQQGFYFCLMPETYLPVLIDMDAQIANSRIDELSLHLLQIASNPVAVFNLCRQMAKKESVAVSTGMLKDSGFAIPTSDAHSAPESVESADCAPWRDLVLGAQDSEFDGVSFVTTVRGKIAQRLPLAVPASILVCQGLLFSLDAVMILAAAIVSSGTPFYTFLGDRNPEERRRVVDDTSKLMRDMAGGRPSDMIASLNITLEYKRMTADGLSERDEEAWCEARACSRIRLQMIVQLEAQIKEQLGAVVSFVDVTDVDAMLEMVSSKANVISALTASAFFDRAIYVEHDKAHAQRKRKAGTSLFLGYDALCDFQVASCVEWERFRVILPMILQARYDKLFGTFCVRCETWEFNALLLMLNYNIIFDPRPVKDAQTGVEFTHFGVELQETKVAFRCRTDIANQILQFRAGVSARVALQRACMEEHLSVDDADSIAPTVARLGLPAGMTAHALGTRVAGMLEQLMRTVQGLESQGQSVCLPHTGPWLPTKASILLSVGSSIVDYTMPAPPKPEPTPAPIEDDEA